MGVLTGKKVITFGDSIVDGHLYKKAGFMEFVAEQEGMSVTKYANNGACIMPGSPIDEEGLGGMILEDQIRKAAEDGLDPDYVVFDGGTNDAYAPVMEKLGEINLTDNPSIRDMLTVELERAEGNGAFLAEGLYERQALGALVPYIQTEIDGKICRTRITPKLLKGYGMSREAVMKQAMDNVQKKNPARLFRMGASEGLSYFIVSGKDREGGATAALYPGMLDELRRKIGEDYYVVPTSKGEVVAMGKSEGVSLDILQKFLVERNRTQEPSQILSSRIFEYKDDEKQLSVCRPDRNRDMGR